MTNDDRQFIIGFLKNFEECSEDDFELDRCRKSISILEKESNDERTIY
jgi:hypothetical protein